MKNKNPQKGFYVHFGIAFILAVALVYVGRAVSVNQAFSNADLRSDTFVDIYVMTDKNEKGRCFLADRRDSTIRRSRKKIPSKKRECTEFGGAEQVGNPDYWFLKSKEHGVLFFVPVEAVEDWLYPFYYEFVSKELDAEKSDLPESMWYQLYVNRIYKGLFLGVKLPFDPRKKDGGSGVLREILIVNENNMTVIDTRFNPDAGFYYSLLAVGRFPSVKEEHNLTKWLIRKRVCPEKLYLLENKEPFEVSHLPLPVCISDIYRRFYDDEPRTIFDERYFRWSDALEDNDEDIAYVMDEDMGNRLNDGLRTYREKFCHSLATHLKVNTGSSIISDPDTYGPRFDAIGISGRRGSVSCKNLSGTN